MFKKISSLILACVLGISTVGCGSTTLEAGIKNPKKILSFAKKVNIFESAESNITSIIETELNNQPFNISLKNNSTHSMLEEKTIRETTFNIAKQESISTIYLEKEKNKAYLYTKLNDQWKKTEVDEEVFNNILLSTTEPINFGDIMKESNKFNVVEEEENYILEGEIPFKNIEGTLIGTNALNISDIINFDVSTIDGDTSIDLKLIIQKNTGYLKSIEMDIINIANQELSEALLKIIDLPIETIKLQLKSFKIKIEFSQINSIEMIQTPEGI